MDFSGGINSGRVTTIASPSMPYGLKPNQLAWGTNITVRGGGVRSRTGQKPLVQGAKWSGLYQGGYRYEPDFAFPYLILQIGGRIYQVRVDTDNSVHDLSAQFGNLKQPSTVDQAFMRQGEQFLVMQAGDNITNPLFWDGTTLTRSRGFIGPGNPQNQIPPATAMDYYQGRLWYAIGRRFIAGDIVGGPSGSLPFQKRDSILNVTENPVASAGDFFTVPSNALNIRAMWHPAELDTTLGQGQLLIGTPRSIYRLTVPVTRDDWTKATANNTPFQTVAQIRYGPVGERSIVLANGDTFYQTLEPGIRSLVYAVRYFHQWGNTPISRPENRVLAFNDRSLLRFSSGIEFDNRLLQTALPYQTPVGVAHRGLLPLDFDLLNEIVDTDAPAWEGMLEGIQILQMFEGDFGGLQRAFAVVVSDLNGQIEVWEMTNSDRFDKMVGNDGNRINWFIETPSYTWGDPFKLKELDTVELWIDKLLGTVNFKMQYRPDQHACWIDWHEWKECSAKSCEEDLDSVSCSVGYPSQPFCEDFKATMTLPKPHPSCIKTSGRPSTQGYQFQFRLNIKGWCRLRGLLPYAWPIESEPFKGLVC
jgi:hypothetical protein